METNDRVVGGADVIASKTPQPESCATASPQNITIYTCRVDIAETIAERKIREAMAEGAFENLPGTGEPIEDIEEYREPGWWAARAIEEERRRHD